MQQKQSLVKRISKVGLLLSVKESYLFSKNSLGLVLHPFKTLRGLQREKDRSQQLLILGWPVYVLLVGLFGVWLAQHSLGKAGKDSVVLGIFIPKLLVVVGWTLIVLALFMIGYLGYWVVKVWRME